MDSPNQKQTRFLKLRYLDPSQAQPEVKINEAWDILDEAIENGLPINTGGSDSGGGSIVVEELGGDSPGHSVTTGKLIIEGARVETAADGTSALIIIDASGPGITVQEIGGVSPGEAVEAVLELRFSGATVTPESNGVALIAINTPSFIESAGWNSSGAPVLVSLAVPQDIQIPYGCTLQNVRIQTQGGTGSCTITLSESAFPFVSGSDITGGLPPAISGGTSHDDSALSGWTTVFAQGAMIRATLSACSGFTSVKIMMRFA